MPARSTFIAAVPGALIALAVQPALAADPEAGERVFRKCQSCHQVGPEAANRVGPVLNGIVGAAAAQGDYAYSDALKASGITWDEATLAAYLRSPKDVVPGGKMTFAGLRQDEEIADVIAYLGRFGPDGSAAAE